jgi:hypothetical protein
MRATFLRATACVLVAVASTAAPAAEYVDAVNYQRAAGQMFQRIVSMELRAHTCSERFPDQSAQIAADHASWQRQDAVAIEATNAFLRDLESRNPGFIDTSRKSVLVASRGLLDQVMATDGAAEYCRASFADLAAGVWRTRTPKVYEFLENKRSGG